MDGRSQAKCLRAWDLGSSLFSCSFDESIEVSSRFIHTFQFLQLLRMKQLIEKGLKGGMYGWYGSKSPKKGVPAT